MIVTRLLPPLAATGFMTTTARHSSNKCHESLGTKVSCFHLFTLINFESL